MAKEMEVARRDATQWIGRPGEVLLLAAGACGFALAALALTLTVAAADGPIGGDVRIARAVQGTLPLGNFSTDIRSMTNTEAVAVSATIAAVGLWYAGRQRQAAVLIAGMATLVVLTIALKALVDRDRPPPELIDVGLAGRSPSFPSGHAISAAMFFGYLVYVVATANVRLRLRVLGISAAVGVVVASGAATVHTGVHWPSDVVGGYLWAAVLVLGMVAADRWFALRDEVAANARQARRARVAGPGSPARR